MAGLSFLLETMYESDVAMFVHYQPKVLMHDGSHSFYYYIIITCIAIYNISDIVNYKKKIKKIIEVWEYCIYTSTKFMMFFNQRGFPSLFDPVHPNTFFLLSFLSFLVCFWVLFLFILFSFV